MPPTRDPARKSNSGPSGRDDLTPLPLPFDVVTHTVDGLLRRFRTGDVTPLGPHNTSRPPVATTAGSAENRDAMPAGLRHVLSPNEGTGYWDFFRPMPHVMLSITDCTYSAPHWTPIPGEDIFKVRILCSGRLLDDARRPMASGPAFLYSFHRAGNDYKYIIDSGEPVKLVMIHFYREALSEGPELAADELPRFLQLGQPDARSTTLVRQGTLSPEVLNSAREILESRYSFSGGLRRSFLQAKCREILTRVISELRSAELDISVGPRYSARDRNLVGEARDYLLHNFRNPPAIGELARRVGMSPTKLKSAFKCVVGLTIHSFVQDIRMRKASEMLLAGNDSIGEVAYAVGYEHPANFTSAFRRHFGFLPRALKSKRGR